MISNHSTTDYQAVIASPVPNVACLGIRVQNGQLTELDFLAQAIPAYVETSAYRSVAAIENYFNKRQDDLLLDVCPVGTAFQKRVWEALRKIPFGQVRRYGELATELGSSARAVAGACRANPLPLLIPCHRVVSANGPGGYMGKTSGSALAVKLWLLQHEGNV